MAANDDPMGLAEHADGFDGADSSAAQEAANLRAQLAHANAATAAAQAANAALQQQLAAANATAAG